MTAPCDKPHGTLRNTFFRFAAIFVGISPFLAMEAGLHLAGWQPRADLRVDPFVEFHGTNPLFMPDETGQHMRTAENRAPFFQPDSFPIAKDKNEFRIFVLGGSTVQGRPYSIESSFTTWLELALQSAEPARKWDVVNCGGVSYASYRLVPILREILNYQPDFIVVYTGHNEFLEDRTYANVKQMPNGMIRIATGVAKLKSFQLIRHLCGDWVSQPEHVTGSKTKTELKAEVDALLDYRNGLEDYHRDAQWQAGVIQHLDFNLRRMARLAKEAGVPLVIVNPAVNQKDCPPFKIASDDDLSDSLREQVADLWSQAKAHQSDSVEQAIGLLKQALAIDDLHAGLHYHIAQCYLHVGKVGLAKHHFNRAKDEDVCPLRMLSSMRETINDVAHETGTSVIDAQQEFEKLSDDGITGDHLFIDHVHPNLVGHQQLSSLLLTHMTDAGFVAPQPGWEARREQRYKDHLLSLDAVYFEHGEQRLEGLRMWTQGRGKKVRGE